MKFWQVLPHGWAWMFCWVKEARVVWSHLRKMSRVDRSIETESRLMVTKDSGEGTREWLLTDKGFPFGWKYSRIRQWWWLHNSPSILRIPELYTLKWWILWHVNYSSTKKTTEFCNSATSFSVLALLFVLLLCKSFPPGNSISHMFQNSKDIKEHLTPLQSTPSYSVPLSKSKLKKHLLPGILWQSSGQEDSMLPMQGAWVWSLVEELRSYMPRCNQKLINKWIKWQRFFF